MTDLEEFQEIDKKYCADLKRAITLSVEQHTIDTKKQDSVAHFENVFIPFINSFSISFEAFCIIILRGYSRRCGSCVMYRDKRYQSTNSPEDTEDAMHDFCPHLVCSEWSFFAKMRSIGKVFWERFLKTRPGRYALFCFPQCKTCYWTDMYECGAATKRHCPTTDLKLTMRLDPQFNHNKFTTQCLCVSVAAREEIEDWCIKAGLSTERIIVRKCFCRQN